MSDSLEANNCWVKVTSHQATPIHVNPDYFGSVDPLSPMKRLILAQSVTF